jgi:hypothetical protein
VFFFRDIHQTHCVMHLRFILGTYYYAVLSAAAAFSIITTNATHTTHRRYKLPH